MLLSMKKMLRLFYLLCHCVVFAILLSVSGSAEYVLSESMVVYAQEDAPTDLYAVSAVLLDGDSGRVLFSKNGEEQRAMASTTKIMTCILALEYGELDGTVTASENAAGQPKVHLGMQPKEEYTLRDLLYSLMLESHNDSAVAIAEHIGGSVEGFTQMMNAKAKELGCEQTHFVTPNGLDGSDEGGTHGTTAEELALIMRYCVRQSAQREMFLAITQTPAYQVQELSGKRTVSCNNHNALLTMMEECISGKTGFTSDAGYCYVGAVESEGRTFIIALLACGWPNNKSYKWADSRKLIAYAEENYTYQNIKQQIAAGPIPVENGVPDHGEINGTSTTALHVPREEIKLLLSEEDKVEIKSEIPESVTAPVRKGKEVGSVEYYLNGKLLKSYPVTVQEEKKERTYLWSLQMVLNMIM